MMVAPDRAALAGRIQGFGNVNPPPLKEDTRAQMAKNVVTNVGGMIGEELKSTVQELGQIREKGAVVFVKDAVVDTSELLYGGAAGIFGWVRGAAGGAAPQEEQHEAAEEASKVLSNGPRGAAYGISQASPTGGLNAVWVMPDQADPTTLAQLAQQSGQALQPPGAPRIQPYQAPSSSQPHNQPAIRPGTQIPGGPVIQPYQPGGPVIQPYQPLGPGQRAPAFPSAASAGAFWPPGVAGSFGAPGGPGAPGGLAPGGGSPQGGVKAFVERVAKGELLVSPEVAQRLVRQCVAAKATAKQLAEVVCERARRLYLGLDDNDPAASDEALARILSIVDALAQQDGELAKDAVKHITSSVSEELLSLSSSAKHKAAAEPMLQRLGLLSGVAKAAKVEEVDLLGGGLPEGSGETQPQSMEATSLEGLFDPLQAPASPAAAGISSPSSLHLNTPPAQAFPAFVPAAVLPAGGPQQPGVVATCAASRKAEPEDPFGFVGTMLAA